MLLTSVPSVGFPFLSPHFIATYRRFVATYRQSPLLYKRVYYFSSMKKAWYNKKGFVISMHIAAWVLLFSLPYLLRRSYNPDEAQHQPQVDTTMNFIGARINDIALISFFYLNALLLIPKLFYKRRYGLYMLAVVISFAVYVFVGWLVFSNFMHSAQPFQLQLHLLFSTFTFLFILACSIAYKTIRDKIIADNLAREIENEFLKTELSLLRSQVSPHFMFNVLNNMVALARKKSDHLEDSLIKLSQLMRYMLYETDEAKVSLEKESDYLQSYIDLQQQRFGKKVQVNVAMHAADKMYDIEPMLLIPFVENAFKHGTGLVQYPQIDINLSAEKEQLTFTVSNKFDAASVEIKDKASGIGLANVQRRLQLLYPNKHTLRITKQNGTFIVNLQINLSA
jgi:two-component system LytT family sensor kinase